MLNLTELVNENKETILSMGQQWAEYFALGIEQGAAYCHDPAIEVDAREYYDLFTDSRESVLEAVYQQHRKAEVYLERFLDYHRPTKEIKCAMRTLESRGYAVGYADGILFVTLETTFGAIAAMIACDSWNAESIEYDRASKEWRNVQDFEFCPWRTLTDYRDRDGYPSI